MSGKAAFLAILILSDSIVVVAKAQQPAQNEGILSLRMMVLKLVPFTFDQSKLSGRSVIKALLDDVERSDWAEGVKQPF